MKIKETLEKIFFNPFYLTIIVLVIGGGGLILTGEVKPTLSLEQRVYYLEVAITEHEQWHEDMLMKVVP